MRLMMPIFLAVVLPARVAGQQQWQQLPGAGQAYAVDVHSLANEGGLLRARIRTRDMGNRIVVQEVQVRCASSQLRTVRRQVYDADTGKPLPQPAEERTDDGSAWPEYAAGSEGHAVLSGLCEIARRRKVLDPTGHSLGAA